MTPDELADLIAESMAVIYLHTKVGRVADDRQSTTEFQKACGALRALLDHVETITAERDALAHRVKVLDEFALSMRDNWDCDRDAHYYNTPCRCCEAEKVLRATPTPEAA